jgi:hypothetical protein
LPEKIRQVVPGAVVKAFLQPTDALSDIADAENIPPTAPTERANPQLSRYTGCHPPRRDQAWPQQTDGRTRCPLPHSRAGGQWSWACKPWDVAPTRPPLASIVEPAPAPLPTLALAVVWPCDDCRNSAAFPVQWLSPWTRSLLWRQQAAGALGAVRRHTTHYGAPASPRPILTPARSFAPRR